MGKDKEEQKSFASPRDALSFLLNDETEAVNGYDLVLRTVPLEEADRVKLERIRNAEIDHIKDLSDIYQRYSTAKFVGTDSKPVKDSKWTMHQHRFGYFYFKDSEGNAYTEDGVERVFGDKDSAGEFYVKNLYNEDAWGGVVPRVVVDAKVKDARGAGNVVKTDGGWIVTSDHNGWLMYSPHHHGALRYGSTFREHATVFKTEAEANKVAQEMLREVYGVKDYVVKDESLGQRLSAEISRLPIGRLSYHTHVDGSVAVSGSDDDLDIVYETLKDKYTVVKGRYGLNVSDSVIKDYSARGSFNSIGELKSHYAGATLLPEGDKITVVLKSGAELVYSYVGNGKLAFIRGKN